MFNDKSTHNERQEALQTVMRKGDADVGEQVHSPAQLNKLLARSTEEFNIFQQVRHSLPLPALFCLGEYSLYLYQLRLLTIGKAVFCSGEHCL